MSPAVDRSGPVDQRPGHEAVPGSQGTGCNVEKSGVICMSP